MFVKGLGLALAGMPLALSLATAAAQAPAASAPTHKVGDEWRYTNGGVGRVVAIENGKLVTTDTLSPRCPDCRYVRDGQFTVIGVMDKNGKPVQSDVAIGLQTRVFPMEIGKEWGLQRLDVLEQSEQMESVREHIQGHRLQ
jgi:hypothetical protein